MAEWISSSWTDNASRQAMPGGFSHPCDVMCVVTGEENRWVQGSLDARLVAAQNGDRDAWRQLFDEFAPAIAGYARLQGAIDADDIVGETFLAVFRRIGEFEGTAVQFRSWLFVIAHRRVIDHHRRRSRADTVPIDEASSVASRSGEVETSALSRIGTDRVVELCGLLSSDQRDVLLLRILADLTIEQVADVVDKSVPAVKALQRRGLARLDKIVRREGVPL